MRPLIMDATSDAEVARVLVHARKRENWYLITRDGRTGSPPPGDEPRHVVHFQVGFRAVFSVTKPEGDTPFRHLTISVDGPKYPSPEAAWMIARAFGFTGPDPLTDRKTSTWTFDINKKDHCITLAQPVREEEV